ncbi:MAG: dipicolinate synthase subunit DpsA [Lachnospiraceae bacterium]|nr:dipicolinate synthase subunit DpsA [Lachnospiraceae bacterium]
MNHSYDFAIIGGDMRQAYLAKELADCNFRVCYYALCKEADLHALLTRSSATSASSLSEACDASCIVCPIPLCKNGTLLNQTAQKEELPVNAVLSYINADQFFFAGCIPNDVQAKAVEKGAVVHDLMQDMRLSYFNTIATAEGAVCEAIARSPVNLRKSSCAVIGYGKCGKTICQYLTGMLCHVCVIAEPELELAEAATVAETTGNFSYFKEAAGQFDFIFNTVPVPIIDADILKSVKRTTTIIDIASPPGGIDYDAANEFQTHAVLCPGLPGKYAPYSSAKAIMETIKSILKE